MVREAEDVGVGGVGRSFLSLWAYVEVNQRKGWLDGPRGLNLRRMGIFLLKNEQSSLNH